MNLEVTRSFPPAAVPAQPYDPAYDPLVDRGPGRNRDYAPTYWVASAGAPPPDDGPLLSDRDADVVIIGSGFTGLACALFLAREHGIKATVLEANRVAWGCSTRNGGQGQNASGRLSRSQWIARWGQETALKLHAEIREGFDLFADLTREFACDPQPGGHLYVAHRPRMFDKLAAESEVCNRVFGYATRMVPPRRVAPRLDRRGRGPRCAARAARHRRPPGQARLRLSRGGAVGRRQSPHREPGDGHRARRRRFPRADPGRNRAGSRGGDRDGRLHRAVAGSQAAQPHYADPVQLVGDASAHARRDRVDELPHPPSRH